MSCTLTCACCLLPCCCKRVHVSQCLLLSLQGECPHDARLKLETLGESCTSCNIVGAHCCPRRSVYEWNF